MNLLSYINRFLFEQPEFEHKAADLGLLLARLYAGITIMGAGLDKIPVPDWMVDQVITIGFPFPIFFAWIACFTEFIFGFMLAFGMMTRLSGVILGITMGTAAFGFHKALPLLDMHLAQHFFWMFIIFATLGGGRYSVDALIRKPGAIENSRWVYSMAPVFALLIGTGFWLQFSTPVQVEEESGPVISSINIPGSFNAWDPTSNAMTETTGSTYILDVDFDGPGLIGFKFTANQSWDINLGAAEPITPRFPLSGQAVVDNGNTTQNIETYIPAAGTYRFTLDRETYAFTVDSLASSGD